MVSPNSQNARILRALSDGRWHSVATIHRKAGTCRLNSRISELRRRHGYTIEHQKIEGASGALGHRYRLLDPPSPQELARLVTRERQDVLDRDETPRDQAHRYRIYRMIYDELELVATASNPEEIGQAILRCGGNGLFDRSCFGLLDTHGSDEAPGTWILNPWDTTP